MMIRAMIRDGKTVGAIATAHREPIAFDDKQGRADQVLRRSGGHRHRRRAPVQRAGIAQRRAGRSLPAPDRGSEVTHIVSGLDGRMPSRYSSRSWRAQCACSIARRHGLDGRGDQYRGGRARWRDLTLNLHMQFRSRRPEHAHAMVISRAKRSGWTTCQGAGHQRSVEERSVVERSAGVC